MNKYLISTFGIFLITNCYAAPSISVSGDTATIKNYDNASPLYLDDLKAITAEKLEVYNSLIIIDNLSDWQDWNGDIKLVSGVSLKINNLDNTYNGEKLEHILNPDVVDVIVKDPLFRVNRETPGGDSSSVYLNLVRETDYSKVFKDNRGVFLNNIRQSHPDDKMLQMMDSAKNMNEINSVMNSSYHFNPKILTNPIKTINRAILLNFFGAEQDFGVGADVDFIMSDKINNFGGHVYISDKYEDLFFKIGLNLNRFSYADNINEFTGLSYGADIRAKQFIDNFWLDGILGISRSGFDADYVYNNGDISEKPKGMSEYARLSVGYDIKRVSDFVLSPFVGLMFQKSDIIGLSDTNINLHTGIIGKYNFVMEGIKYVYGASVATDENTNWNIGANIGFVSVIDNAGADFEINTFKDEFGTNYKFSIKAKVQF